MSARSYALAGSLAALAATVCWLVQAFAEVQVGTGFQPGESVQSIRVEIAVAPGGEDLDEPLALDLGLGFPLWLQRLGRVDSTVAPFGAVSQSGTDAHAIRAGERATFEFTASGVAGLDVLRTTDQLLAGVQVSDISRVGFTSPAEHGWILAGYKIDINGKPFVANDAVNANGRGLQDAARERLQELNRDLAPQQTELTDLQALAATGLATAADQTRLAELQAALAPQIAEQRRIERQLRGAAPLFVESGFRPQGRTSGAIESMRVTVITAPHTGAETRNYVYFRAGGHKYLLGSPLHPLSPDYGEQVFELDLATGPLVAGDLRGYGLGMLAHAQPGGDTPDRWHPQRLRIEVDGRAVYDSEENSLDRSSLAAIRLIPPAQMNSDDSAVVNTPIEREAFVWLAGSGAGLDLVNGGPAELPGEDDPTYPDPEPGITVDQDITINEETWYDPDAGPFPGETGFPDDWEPGWAPGWGPGWHPGWGPGLDPGWGPGWIPGPSWLDLLLLGLLDELDVLPDWVLPDWVIPDPVGEPPQLEEVTVDRMTGTIHWTVTGDEAQIDHFTVDVVRVRPDLDVPLDGMLSMPLEVAAHERSVPLSSLVMTPVMETADSASRGYLAVRVTMVPTDPAIGVDPGLAPAVPLRVMLPGQSLHLSHDFIYTEAGGPTTHPAVAFGGEPELPGRAVWLASEIDAHTGVVFGGYSPLQHHIVARPDNDGDVIEVRLHSDVLPPGNYRLIAYLGFQGALEEPADVLVTQDADLRSILDPSAHNGYPLLIHLTADPALPPGHLIPLIADMETSDVAPGPMALDVRYRLTNIHVDPRHPPVLFGVRLIEM
ncbi:MAG: hypothetical protein MUF20_08655 [Methylotetracoccus sp.]|nr:hypothetical protein [Methylotetracoccus sp.]